VAAILCNLVRSARCIRARNEFGPTISRTLLCNSATRGISTKMSRARVFADVLKNKPQEYWDYEALSIQWKYASLSSWFLCPDFDSSFLRNQSSRQLRSREKDWAG
jgi:hypothetical protein